MAGRRSGTGRLAEDWLAESWLTRGRLAKGKLASALRAEDGATAVEYGVLVSTMGILVYGGYAFFGEQLNAMIIALSERFAAMID